MARLLLLQLLVVVAAAHGNADPGGDEAPPPELLTKSLIFVKIWCLILVFAGTFAGGVSPYFLKWNERVLLLFGTPIASGVFIYTALNQFLSYSNENFGDLTVLNYPFGVNYPFTFILANAGYAITMLADCLISMVATRGNGVRNSEAGGGEVKVISNESGSPKSTTQAEDCTHNQSLKFMLPDSSSLGDSILLIGAFCFHSVFEGIAIGVAETKADACEALWTIRLHKIFAAIAMGMALLRKLPNLPLLSCVAYAFAFAVSSPIGVAIGVVIRPTTEGPVADWIYIISVGLSCGIFLYVSINSTLLVTAYKPRKLVAVDSPLVMWAAVLFLAGVAAVMIQDT